MPVIEHRGDLLKSDCNVIIHCCNCFNTMGAGIARAIAQRYPEAKQADDMTNPGDKSKLGNFTWAESSDKIIFNLYGQYHYGAGQIQVDYVALRLGLIRIRKFLEEEMAFYKIGTYRLGCGLAGGDWNIVRYALEEVFNNLDVHVYTL